MQQSQVGLGPTKRDKIGMVVLLTIVALVWLSFLITVHGCSGSRRNPAIDATVPSQGVEVKYFGSDGEERTENVPAFVLTDAAERVRIARESNPDASQ